MIEQANSAQSLELAEHLDNAGYLVTPVAGSPLSTLVRLSSINPIDENRPAPEQMETGSQNSEHDTAMAEEVALAVAAVSQHMDFARNVATPVIESFVKRLSERCAKVSVNPYFDLKISEVGVPQILRDTDMMETINKFNNGTSVIPSDALRYQSVETDQIRELMHTGSGPVDRMIDEWVKGMPEGFLQTVWQSVYQNKVAYEPTAKIEPIDDLLKDPYAGADACLMIFLMAQRLAEDTSLNADMSLVELRDALVQIRLTTATWLVRHMNTMDSYKATGTIIRARRRTELVVDRETYAEFLASGGRVEVLLGAMVGGRNWNTAADLNANAEQALRLWSDYQIANQVRHDKEASAAIILAAKVVFEEGIRSEQLDAEKDYLARPGVIGSMIEAFSKELAELPMGEVLKMDSIWKVAAKVRFGYTPSTRILQDIDYYVSEKGLTIEQASSHAMFLYVLEYVKAMVESKYTRENR